MHHSLVERTGMANILIWLASKYEELLKAVKDVTCILRSQARRKGQRNSAGRVIHVDHTSTIMWIYIHGRDNAITYKVMWTH